MRYFTFLLFLSVFCFSSVVSKPADKKKYYVFKGCDQGRGFFSIFMEILYGLHAYEQGFIAGFEVDCGTTSLYYDPQYGPNFWEYYFEPIVLGNKRAPHTRHASNLPLVFKDQRRETNLLIQKYIHPKAHIQEKIDNFIAENFQDFYVLGVHYRGTDKKTEAGRVTYEKMIKRIKLQVDEITKTHDDYRIFVATDEQQFIYLMRDTFPGKVCFNSDAIRSFEQDYPVHFDIDRNPYQIGEDAVIDCILLSKTNFLMLTVSNLSFCSLYFNPDLVHNSALVDSSPY